jgi:hypothetical protein
MYCQASLRIFPLFLACCISQALDMLDQYCLDCFAVILSQTRLKAGKRGVPTLVDMESR